MDVSRLFWEYDEKDNWLLGAWWQKLIYALAVMWCVLQLVFLIFFLLTGNP